MEWVGETLTRCPSCGSSRIGKSGVRKDAAIVFECADCNLGFLNPMPCLHEIARFYQDYFDRDDGIGYAAYLDIGKYYWLDYYIFARLKESGIKPNSSVLDIGCANGNKVLFFQERGYHSKGIDLSEEATAYGRKTHGLDLLKSSIEDYSTEERFDVIIMLEFVEHIRDPWIWAKKVSELLRPGGVVVITTPNYALHKTVGDDWSGFQTSFEHLHFFSPQSLRSLLEKVGIRVEYESSLKTMPVRSNPGEDSHQKRLGFALKLDELSGHRIRRIYKSWQNASGPFRYDRYAGGVYDNHTMFILARKD